MRLICKISDDLPSIVGGFCVELTLEDENIVSYIHKFPFEKCDQNVGDGFYQEKACSVGEIKKTSKEVYQINQELITNKLISEIDWVKVHPFFNSEILIVNFPNETKSEPFDYESQNFTELINMVNAVGCSIIIY